MLFVTNQELSRAAAMRVQKIILPELEAVWKWPRNLSPHLADIEQECLEWSASFEAFTPETQSLVHDRGKLSECLIACSLFP